MLRPLLFLALVGCPPATPLPTEITPTDPPTVVLPDPDDVELRGGCPLSERVGGFILEQYATYSVLQGQVNDGVVPITVLEQTQALGDCRLLRRNNPICDPSCSPGTTCDHDGVCITQPLSVSLGTLTIDGLGPTRAIEPIQPGNTYFVPELTHPAFSAGQVVRLAFPDTELFGVGVQPLVVLTPDVVVVDGQDLTLRWEPPATPGRGEIALEFSVDQHGNTPQAVHCTFPDTGSGTVPTALIDALLNAGVSGFPNGRLLRRTRDRITTDGGCADFSLASPVSPAFSVDGVTPCEDSDDCPNGTCNPVTFICEP